MKAKIRNRTVGGRRNLSEVVPLSTPYVIVLDPSSACNLKCVFCPTGDKEKIRASGRYQGYMSFDLFKKIIEDLDKFDNNINILRLYKEGEPLLNPRFTDFILYARKSRKIERIDVTTNGLLLTKYLSEKIISSGIDQINISINGIDSTKHYALTKRPLDLDKLIENISYLHKISGSCEIYVKAISEHLNDEEKLKFFDLFGNIADRVFLENLQPNWPNFSFNHLDIEYTVGHYGQPLIDRDVCPYIFYMIVINSDGSVSACVQDWQHRLIVGDTRENKINEIWLGKELKELQIKHLSYRRCENEVCSVCPVLRHGTLDNIDDNRSSILDKILEGK